MASGRPGGTILAGALAGALAGCTVGPDYRPPAEIGGPPPVAFASATTQVTGDEVPDDWWRLYGDPVLDRLIAQALTENTSIRVAVANLAVARGVLDQARSARLPSTGVSAGASYGTTAGELAAARAGRRDPDPDWTLQAGFSLSWEIDLFGRVRRQVEASRADYQASAATLDGVRTSVAAETARAYADACGYAASVAVQRRSLDVAARGVALTQAQRRAGAVGDYEVARSEALAAQTAASIPSLSALHANALYRLAILTGRPPEVDPGEAGRCAAPPVLARPIPVGDGGALIARRPDVRAAERSLAGATARIGVATADLYPTISLGGLVSSAASSVAGLGSASNRSWSLGPLLSWVFPNITGARARIRQAEARTRAQLATFDGTVLTALGDVEQALSTEAGDLDRRDRLAVARDRDARAARLAERRYEAGAIGFLDLLDTRRALIADEAALATADQTVATDQILLFKALGGGWRGAVAEPPERR